MNRRAFLSTATAGSIGLLQTACTGRSLAPPGGMLHVVGAGGVRLCVETAGDPRKPAILFLHDFSQSRLCWQRQLDSDLALDFFLVAMDHRGHGLSDVPDGDAAYRDGRLWADDVDAVIRELALHRPVLAAWSFGSSVACDYVRYHGQEHIGGIHFVCALTERGDLASGGLLDPAFRALVPGLVSDSASETCLALQAYVRLLTAEPLSAADHHFFLGCMAAVLPRVRRVLAEAVPRTADVLDALRVPVLVLHGQRDAVVRPAAAAAIAERAPTAVTRLYPGLGHAPFFEDAERFNRDLAAFVRRVTRT